MLTRLPIARRNVLLCTRAQRQISTDVHRDPLTGELTSLPDIQASLLRVTTSTNPRPPPASSTLVFGRTFTDHMLTIPWTLTKGWGAPAIRPYGSLDLEPSASVFHYAQCLFEGMKAYRDEAGKVMLFRPEMNMARMNNSAKRIALPTFDGNALLQLIKKLVHKDRHWIPKEPGHSLYIRPTLIGTQRAVGINPPEEALLFVICSPVGPYYPTGFKPVALYGTTEYIRAAPGGTGGYKVGANYAPGVVPQREAAEKGYAQNLWLWGPEHYLTEVGTMNCFAVFERDGETELVTPPLDGMILPGVTRDSVLRLARAHVDGSAKLPGLSSKLIVNERPMTMNEVKIGAERGTLREIFGTGTAAIISPVNRIGYMGEDIAIPTGEDGMGDVSRAFWTELVERQFGRKETDWTVYVTE